MTREHQHDEAPNTKDNLIDLPAMSENDKQSLVDSLVEEMHELFHGYVDGAYAFDEVTFEMFDTLQTLHAIATGNLMVEFFDDDDDLDEMEELAGEPVEPDSSRGQRGADRKRGRR